MSFVTDLVSGKATMKDVDDYIDHWHSSNSELSLHEYLGMTQLEYEFFVHTNTYDTKKTKSIFDYITNLETTKPTK